MSALTPQEAREARELVTDVLDQGYELGPYDGMTVARYARELEERLRDCALDLEAELRARYFHNGEECHAAMRPKFERDMEPVKCARALLGEKEG